MSDLMVFPLSNTLPGETVSVVCLANEGLMAARLFDLGFVPRSVISCVLKKKNIAAYLVRSSVIAIREEDSRLIMVKKMDDDREVVR